MYGKDSVKFIEANKGDLIAATTTAFHRGTKPLTNERTMLTINHVIHPELDEARYNKGTIKFGMKKGSFEALPEWKKPVADFLIKG